LFFVLICSVAYETEYVAYFDFTGFFIARHPWWAKATSLLRSYSDTPHLVGLPLASDQPDAETTWQHTTLTSMHPVGFKPAIPASERPHIDASDRAAPGIRLQRLILLKYPRFSRPFVFWVNLVISSMAQ
jgi:hypothetical protein